MLIFAYFESELLAKKGRTANIEEGSGVVKKKSHTFNLAIYRIELNSRMNKWVNK